MDVFERLKGPIDELVQKMSGPLLTVINFVIDAFVGVFDIVGSIVSEIAGPLLDVASAVVDVFAGIVDAIGPSVEGFGEALKGLIENIPFDSMLESVKEIVESIGELWQAILPGIIDLVSNIISELQPAFDLVDRIFKLVSDFVSSLVDEAAPIINDIISMVTETLSELPIEELFESVGNFVGGVLEAASRILSVIFGIVKKFEPTLRAILGILKPLMEFITNAINVVVSLLNGDWAGAWENVKAMFISIWDVITQVWQAIASFFSTIWDYIEPIDTMLTEKYNEFLDSIDEAISTFFTETIPEWINSAIEWFKQLPQEIAFVMGEVFQKIVNFGQDAINWVKNDLPVIINSIVDWFAKLPGQIWDWLCGVVDNIVSWGADALQAGVEAAESLFNGIVEWVQQIPGKIAEWWNEAVEFLKSIDLLQIGKDIINTLWEGLKSMWESVASWFEGIGQNISSFFGGIGKAWSAGRSSVGAYATGLDYVPRTMDVTVHRGERILTEEENKRYNEGGSVEVVTYQNDSAMLKLGAKLDSILEAIDELSDLKVLIDGNKLVGAIRHEMNMQLADEYSI